MSVLCIASFEVGLLNAICWSPSVSVLPCGLACLVSSDWSRIASHYIQVSLNSSHVQIGPNLAVLMLEKAMQRVWIGQDCVCQAKQSEKLYCDTDLFWQSRDSVVPPWPPQHSYF